MKKTATPKLHGITGVKDIITQVDLPWSAVLKRLQKIGRLYGFARIETPILEELQLYKNCYKDAAEPLETVSVEAGNRSYGIRPTILPSVLRAYIQKKVNETEPLSKWLYSGNVVHFEGGTPVSDFEYGVEILGTFNQLTEAQTIAGMWHMMQDLGLTEATLEINTIGDSTAQHAYQEVLRPYLMERKFDLCDNCNEDLKGRALNVLRCNKIDCQVVASEAPAILDFLDDATQKHFTSILEALDELQIPYQLNPLYVGREGFSKTNVIIRYKKDKDVIVLSEGGYHDSVLKNLGGKGLTSFGFSGSATAIVKAIELAELSMEPEIHAEVFLVPLGDLAAKKSLRLFRDLIAARVLVYDHFGTAGVKNQLKQAEMCKSPLALIMGQKEAMDEMVILRDVKSGMQEVFSYDKIIDEVKKRLGR